MSKFESLSPDDVLVFVEGVVLAPHSTALGSELLEGLAQASFKGSAAAKEKLLGDGLRCKRLKPGGGGWESGTLQIHLRFAPDDPDMGGHVDDGSSLDEFRQS